MTARKPAWERSAPKRKRRRHLTPAKKAQAKSTARKAGRRYPNLVDNLRAASS